LNCRSSWIFFWNKNGDIWKGIAVFFYLILEIFSPAGESLFFASPKKSNQKKGDPSRTFSCALQKIAVVPMRHPCRNVTKTNILFVFQRLSSSARGAHMGWKKQKKQKQKIFSLNKFYFALNLLKLIEFLQFS